jgi:hypothetical protein
MADQGRTEELKQLLAAQGEPGFGWTHVADGIDYVGSLGLTQNDVGPLSEIANLWATTTEWPEDKTDTTIFAPVHAWRAMAQLRSADAVDPIIALQIALAIDDDDDWMLEDFAALLAMIGPTAIDALTAVLDDPEVHDNVFNAAAEAIGNIGKAHPEARDRCVALLGRLLGNFEEQSQVHNSFLLNSMRDLHAVEYGDLIERAYAADAIDLPVAGNWRMTRDDMGLTDHGLVPEHLVDPELHEDSPKWRAMLKKLAEVERLRLAKQRETLELQKKRRDDHKKRKRRSR